MYVCVYVCVCVLASKSKDCFCVCGSQCAAAAVVLLVPSRFCHQRVGVANSSRHAGAMPASTFFFEFLPVSLVMKSCLSRKKDCSTTTP